MRTNFVLIDYENVQPASLTGLDEEHFKLLLFVGANQTKIPFEIASSMQKLGSSAEYVKISGNGPNALDFHIAFYIGELAAKEPGGYFHVISKDSGFDPLIQHLQSRKISVLRSKSLEDVPILRPPGMASSSEMVSTVIANLRQRGAAKPRTLKTLTNSITSIFMKQLSEGDLDNVLTTLQSRGFISVNGTKVSYSLPDDAPCG